MTKILFGSKVLLVTRNILSTRLSPAPEGRQIKALIALRGLRVEAIASAVGISRPVLYRMLSGERSMTEDERARILAAIDAAPASEAVA